MKQKKNLSDDKTFIGCYPHDKLPKIKDKVDCSVIINTGSYNIEGDPWVAVKMTKYNCFTLTHSELKQWMKI